SRRCPDERYVRSLPPYLSGSVLLRSSASPVLAGQRAMTLRAQHPQILSAVVPRLAVNVVHRQTHGPDVSLGVHVLLALRAMTHHAPWMRGPELFANLPPRTLIDLSGAHGPTHSPSSFR